RPKRRRVLFEEYLSQIGNRLLASLVKPELVGISASFGDDGYRLAAPDQLGAAPAEVAPAPLGELTRIAVGGAVPAFHGEDREAITNVATADFQRPGEGGFARRRNHVVERDGDAEGLKMI